MSTQKITVNSYQPQVIAHRGGADLAAENSMDAFSLAMEHPIHGLECDVQLSKDGVPILFHDRNFKKFSKENLYVRNLTWPELQEYDMGIYHENSQHKISIPTFEEFITKYSNKIHLYIEVKSRPFDYPGNHHIKLIEKVITILNNHETLNENFTIMSFDSQIVDYVLKNCPSWKCIELYDIERPFLGIKKDLFGIGLWLDHNDHNAIQTARKSEQTIFGYTCNSESHFKEAYEHRFDILVTDNPPWLIAKLAQLNKT